MYKYQETNRYFAQAADDIKDLAKDELKALGATEFNDAYRGFHFTATKRTLYEVNYKSALINRVLAPIITFDCHSDRYLYKTASQIEWKDFLNSEYTFAVFATVSHSKITHSKYASLKLKDAIADYFRAKRGKRPDVDTRNPDIWINLHIENNKAVISVDTSGGSLHRRGYRYKSVEAPMMETLAASIIKTTEWKGEQPLCDPFCGSGTLLAEAYLSASNTPPSFMKKKFGFQMLPDYNKSIWRDVRKESRRNIEELPDGLIKGSDISSKAVNAAYTNCSVVDKEGVIRIKRSDVFELEEIRDSVIVCNPPYGIRLNKKEDLSEFYKKFGDFLKQKCTGSTVYVYFGDRQYIKKISLKPSWKMPLNNGGLDGRLVKFELY